MRVQLAARVLAPRKKTAYCFEAYPKVKETASEVFCRSGGVARFSIAAFASTTRGGQSSLYRGGFAKTSPRAVDRGFKRSSKLLKFPPGAPTISNHVDKALLYDRGVWPRIAFV